MRAVTSRLWLGSAMSPHCDRPPIRALLARVRSCGPTHAILLRVDGLGSSVSQARRVFREAVRTGKRGRPRLVRAAGALIARVVKRYAKRRVAGVARRMVRGTAPARRTRAAARHAATVEAGLWLVGACYTFC